MEGALEEVDLDFRNEKDNNEVENLEEKLSSILESELDDINLESNSKDSNEIKNNNKKRRNKKKNKRELFGQNKSKSKPQQKKKKTRPSKRYSRKLIIVLIVLLIAITSKLTWNHYFDYKQVNPFELIYIVNQGGEGQGKIIIETSPGISEEEASILEHIDFLIEENDNLSSGDERTIEVRYVGEGKSFLKEKKIKLDPMSETYTVSDLAELKEVDIFENLSTGYSVKDGKVYIDSIDLNLEDKKLESILELNIPKSGLEFNSDYVISLNNSEQLDQYLKENALTIKNEEITTTIDDIRYVPSRKEEILELSDLEEKALSRIQEDYAKNQLKYHSFELKSVCYSSEPQNNNNASDYYENHGYENGSLMFIFEFKQESPNGTNILADNYGYTNIRLENGKLMETEMKLMSPFQDSANVDLILKQLSDNNFECSS